MAGLVWRCGVEIQPSSPGMLHQELFPPSSPALHLEQSCSCEASLSGMAWLLEQPWPQPLGGSISLHRAVILAALLNDLAVPESCRGLQATPALTGGMYIPLGSRWSVLGR